MKRIVAASLLALLGIANGPTALSALTTAGFDTEALETKRDRTLPPGAQIWDSPAPTAVVVAPPPAPSPAAPERPTSANPLWALPLKTLSTTRERPIFSASRRLPPSAATAVTVTKAPPPPKPREAERPSLALVGTIAGDDESFGIFIDQGTKAALRLKVGEEYQGWKLHDVRGGEVTLAKDVRTVVLGLPHPGLGAAGSDPGVQSPVTQGSATLPGRAPRRE
jgi:hypothetical protein